MLKSCRVNVAVDVSGRVEDWGKRCFIGICIDDEKLRVLVNRELKLCARAFLLKRKLSNVKAALVLLISIVLHVLKTRGVYECTVSFDREFAGYDEFVIKETLDRARRLGVRVLNVEVKSLGRRNKVHLASRKGKSLYVKKEEILKIL
ncbi:MAG: hypothetical protein DRJ31_04720 [Candidatus Methanomethylicota archaeon]|uniref:Uncharacterized protein n=1 Tax=Thermoproteota archaeon TaxID=2056631 RepID=A0A497ESC1_9CREN|nr:MAG: hypothetical protein DRJ31_04720 [Candidatus Verstraetearchaeota archaeon]